MAEHPPEGWHPDPTQRYGLRWWDGSQWTDHVHHEGETFLDPLQEAIAASRAAQEAASTGSAGTGSASAGSASAGSASDGSASTGSASTESASTGSASTGSGGSAAAGGDAAFQPRESGLPSYGGQTAGGDDSSPAAEEASSAGSGVPSEGYVDDGPTRLVDVSGDAPLVTPDATTSGTSATVGAAGLGDDAALAGADVAPGPDASEPSGVDDAAPSADDAAVTETDGGAGPETDEGTSGRPADDEPASDAASATDERGPGPAATSSATVATTSAVAAGAADEAAADTTAVDTGAVDTGAADAGAPDTTAADATSHDTAADEAAAVGAASADGSGEDDGAAQAAGAAEQETSEPRSTDAGVARGHASAVTPRLVSSLLDGAHGLRQGGDVQVQASNLLALRLRPSLGATVRRSSVVLRHGEVALGEDRGGAFAEVTGRGRLLLGDQGRQVHVVELVDETVRVAGTALLAWSSGVEAVRVHGGAQRLTGTGWLALTTRGVPVTVDVDPTTRVPRGALVLWTVEASEADGGDLTFADAGRVVVQA